MTRVTRFLFNTGHRVEDALHLAELKRLPLIRRLCHAKTRRHLLAVSVGIAISLFGSFLASHAHFAEQFVPHFVWDAAAYTVHAIGLGPILMHVEPLWRALMLAGAD